MKVEVENIGSVQRKVTVEVPADRVTTEVNEAFKMLTSEAALPGFRKGKVPEKVLRQRYAGSIMGDVASRLIEETFPQVVKEKELRPVSRPMVDIEEIKEGEPFKYTATVDVRPEFEVKGYKDIKLDKKSDDATDEEVNEALEHLRKSRSDFKEVDRGAKDGDLLVVDFEGFIEGEAIKQGKAEDFQVVLGEGMLLPGFDEALLGVKAGDKKEVNTTFPEKYHEAKLSGKVAVFNVEIKSVKERDLPKLDDEFAKDLEADSLDDLKKKISDEIKGGKEKSQKMQLRNEAIKKLIDANTFDVPESLVDTYFSSVMTEVVEGMKRGQVNPEDRGLDEEGLTAKYREIAVRQVKGDLILDAIAKAEDLDASDDEVEEFVADFAKQKGESVGPLLAKFEKDGTIDAIKSSLIKEKVFDKIVDNGF